MGVIAGSTTDPPALGYANQTANNDAAYFNGTEIVVRNTHATEAYVYDMQGMLVATIAVNNGEATYRPASKGLYVVRCNEISKKVSVQ